MAEATVMKVADIKIGKRHREQMANIAGLAESIEQIGLLHPVVVTPQGKLIAGRRRLEAYKLRGWEMVDARVVDLDKIVRGELAENFEREDFTPSEAVAISEAIEDLERKAAKKRQGTRTDLGLSVESTPSKSRTRIAKAVNMGWQALHRAREIVEAAESKPQEYGKLKAEMDDTGRVAGVYRKLTVARQAELITKEPPPLPKGPFRVIIADPPWTYSKRAEDPSHRGANPYLSMTFHEIETYLPDDMPHANCILWLWTTNAHMPDAFDVVKAWGFTHKTILTWAKDKMGTGDWLRGKTEHCLLAVRGKPTVTLTNQTTILHAKAGKHSAKPDEFYDLVKSFCPGSIVELFQRTPRDGIVGAGLEV